MSRVQLALNVSNLDEAIAFYSALFRTAPAKMREGYANFAIAEPPLKLVLIEGEGAAGTLNHLGVEVDAASDVSEAISHLQSEGLDTDIEEQTTCCYAVQDKVWVHGPDGEPWEVYTVLADADVMHTEDDACCAPDTSTATTSVVTLGAKPADSCC